MSDTIRKVKNPLLSAAGQGNPFDNFGENTLLMPVTPTTPAVLSDDLVPEAPSGTNLTNPLPATINTTVDYSSGNTSSFPEVQKTSTPQGQKQSYFTSILSSLPNLSLSSITGDNNKQDHHQEVEQVTQHVDPYGQNPYGPLAGSTNFVATNPYDSRLPTFESNPVAPQQLPPPATLPPSGGAGSYRLGSQKRLKYAPPPDLTSNTSKQYPVPSAPVFSPQLNTPPPQFFNPNASLSNEILNSPSSQISTSASSNQEIAIQSPFSNSPSVTPINPASFQTSIIKNPPIYSSNAPPKIGVFSSAPEAIPARIPEPLTPQNTPAGTSFSGFVAYDKQSPFVYSGSEITYSSPTAFNTINIEQKKDFSFNSEIQQNSSVTVNDDKTFTPISAAKVTEKLEHLIAEQKEELSTQKSSDLSSEVSEITSRILLEDKLTDCKRDFTNLTSNFDQSGKSSEILTEIDLNAPISEVSLQGPEQSFSKDSVTNLSTASFFLDNDQHHSTLNQLPVDNSNLYNPLAYSNQVSSQLNSVDQNLYTGNSSILSSVSNDPLEQVPHSSCNVNQNSQHTVLNPIYGGSAHTAPTFYNPNQFTNQFNQTVNDPFASLSFPQYNAKSLNDNKTHVDVTCGHSFSSSISNLPQSTGTATLNPIQTSVNPMSRVTQGTVPPSLENLAAGPTEKRMQYRPVYHHWFFRKEVESKVLWIPFSMHDSLHLEEVHNSNEISPETKVATDGGRYDVDILRRERTPVYWPGSATEVRRCSWFYKGSSESRYTPYEESVAVKFEEEYKQACNNSSWNRKIDLNNGEYIIFHSPTVQVHYLETTSPEMAVPGSNKRPRVVKRGVDEFHIEEGEPEKVDHLLFLVHGIGSVCDLKFRSVEEVVDEFRSISLQLVQSHYRSASDQGVVNRIEVLPISWHATLHSEDTGIDKKLQAITLTSIPKLRHFTNDTLLDILFYTSPIYCQTIMRAVGSELNRLFSLFNERNSNFDGNVYLGGHSLGSLILFDLLCHQNPPPEEKLDDIKEETECAGSEAIATVKKNLSRKVSYVMGAAGTGQPYIHYPQLTFHPQAFFALGSPIGMFVTVRGIDTLGEDFTLPTCPAFFNIFHPFDPVAYRVESLINPDAHKYRPKLIPHHKGRKRMHLELKETMARVGADLKQKFLDSVKSTWNSVYQLAMFHKPDNQTFEKEIDKVVEEQLNHSPSEPEVPSEDGGDDMKVGNLNGGRRIDYVLQEAPFEYINEYIFALTSHVCYWESEDTMLLMLKEIYGSMGIQADAQMPQNITIERVSAPSTPGPSNLYQNNLTSPSSYFGVDPTAPISNKSVGPPPITGFIRKS
ncbi:SEC23-interacting protein-like isoform X2 [Leptopilina boulardi]|uniref:SEC23-interacting protein-like isoform X2 n=1 Tax=Leptopilina boulardi TaxID=63433 RepID=UPI0021F638DB|nr:SEC23-interacting protein-like isoform X2 [Leptopilina boulardi]